MTRRNPPPPSFSFIFIVNLRYCADAALIFFSPFVAGFATEEKQAPERSTQLLFSLFLFALFGLAACGYFGLVRVRRTDPSGRRGSNRTATAGGGSRWPDCVFVFSVAKPTILSGYRQNMPIDGVLAGTPTLAPPTWVCLLVLLPSSAHIRPYRACSFELPFLLCPYRAWSLNFLPLPTSLCPYMAGLLGLSVATFTCGFTSRHKP